MGKASGSPVSVCGGDYMACLVARIVSMFCTRSGIGRGRKLKRLCQPMQQGAGLRSRAHKSRRHGTGSRAGLDGVKGSQGRWDRDRTCP